ncbi:MAG: vWA domain-containing protein [Pelotomaculum sp.]
MPFGAGKRAATAHPSVNDVTVGGNLEQLLPSEKMLLANNTTRKDFFRRYHQQELLQYRSDGVYPKARGPMVVCCDVSGSMRGEAEQWSKAMAIALAEVALREKRDFACILFDSQIVDTSVIPRGMWDPNTLINIAEKFTGGGTSFIYPLEKSMELIRTSRFKHADVVVLTDGKCKLPDEFLIRLNQLKAQREFSIVTVLIDTDNSENTEYVREFSEQVIKISSLAELDDHVAAKIISSF